MRSTEPTPGEQVAQRHVEVHGKHTGSLAIQINSVDQHPTKHNLEQVLDEGCSDNTADLKTRNKNNIGVLRILLGAFSGCSSSIQVYFYRCSVNK